MTGEEARSLVERQARAWESADPDAIAADFAQDGVLISPGGRWRGPEEIRAAARGFFAGADSVEIEITRVLVDGEEGAVEWTWNETPGSTGRRRRAEDAIVFEVRGGKISYWREYFDPDGTAT